MPLTRMIWLLGGCFAAWFACWYPWGHPVLISSYVYNEAIPACLAHSGFQARLACGFPGVLGQVYPGFPGIIWLASLLYDPASYTVTPWLQVAYGSILLGSLPFLYSWLRLFKLDPQVRLLSTLLWFISAPMLWFAAGSQNTDGLVLALAVISCGAYVMRRRHKGFLWIAMLAALPIVLVFLYISATAQMYALAVFGITVLQQTDLQRKTIGSLAILAGMAVLAYTGNNSSLVEVRSLSGQNQLALLGLFLSLPGGILGAFLVATLAPPRWQPAAVLLVTVATGLTASAYVFDVPKSDALYVPTERAWVYAGSMVLACVLALRQVRLRLLNLAAIANILVLLFATWATRAATNPNPRHFMLFALAACVWTSFSALRSVRNRRIPWAAVAVCFHMLAVLPALYQPLGMAWDIEQGGKAMAQAQDPQQLPCVENLRYSNTLVGAAVRVPQAHEKCDRYWVVQREATPAVHASWQQAARTTYYYGYLFAPKQQVSHWITHEHTTLHAWPLEWVDVLRQRQDFAINWGIMAAPAPASE